MLKIKLIMGSSVEDIFSFKCCNYNDLNLEIQLTNKGDTPITIPSFCDFASENEKRDRVDYLFPHGRIRLEPGQSCSYYCYMDENKFKKYKQVVFYDDQGKEYRFTLDSE